jgi:hypothetical protein
MHQITATAFPSVTQLNPKIPPHIARLIAKMTAKDRNDRYASAQDLRKDLDKCLAKMPRSADTDPRLDELPFGSS